MRIALAGNPNSGKTTMYNSLTGKNEKVGNWAGVTVEKKESNIKKSLYSGTEKIVAVDLPGAYSMSPFTSEESITRQYITDEKPDAIINIVDATNLSRSLFFTTQLLELGIPVVVALNKIDINEKRKTDIDVSLLSSKLGCPVVNTVAADSKGLKEAVDMAVGRKGKKQIAPYERQNTDLSDRQGVALDDKKRFAFVNEIVKSVEKRKILSNKKTAQDRFDMVVTNKWVGIPIFAVVMFLVFWISQAGPGVWIADALSGYLTTFQEWIRTSVVSAGAKPILEAILIDGIIGGFIAIVGFLPLVMVMYFLIALLEDCGYMARAAVVLDPIFKKVGLSGKSVIPFVITTGCAVPGVMASRTIKNERERRATAMLAPFMPCGAKLPLIAMFASVFFKDTSWISPIMYFAGILLIFIGALLVNLITGNSAKRSYFIIELPEYKVPSLERAFMSMCKRGWSYVVKAGTIILVCNTAVQIMQSFTWGFEFIDYTAIENAARLSGVDDKAVAAIIEGAAETSILASIAKPFSVILIPVVGFAAWQLAAAAITGFIAKENVVGTIAICYGITSFIDVDELAFTGNGYAGAFLTLTKSAALAYLMFNLFTPPCFAAIGAMNAEMKSAKWLWAGIGLQFGAGFTVSFAVYQIGTLITTGALGEGFWQGLLAVLMFAAIIEGLIINTRKKLAKEKAQKCKA